MKLYPVLAMLTVASCGGKDLISDKPAPEPEALAAPEVSAPTQSYAATPPPGVELPTSQTTPGPIPLEFRHVWAIDAADCTKSPSLTRIAIAPGAVKFYEGRSEVVSANTPHEGALVMEVKHAAEGVTDKEIHTLALNDGKLSYERGGQTFTYMRCD